MLCFSVYKMRPLLYNWTSGFGSSHSASLCKLCHGSLSEVNEYFDKRAARASGRKREGSDKFNMHWHLLQTARFPGHSFLYIIIAMEPDERCFAVVFSNISEYHIGTCRKLYNFNCK